MAENEKEKANLARRFQAIPNASEGAEEAGHSHTAGGLVKWHSHAGNTWAVS